ncbi:MAG: trigger factor [Gammaproteobacteria bacterium]|nr:trigger factor [Gammaproteobacteria bacterium]
MQVSIETLEGLERRMTVQVPSETVIKAVDKKLRDLVKTVRIDGFRPGKVPLKVVQQKFGGAVRQEVIGDVIDSTYREAITQEDIHPAGMPNIESINTVEQEDVSYTAVFEVFPEVEELHLDKVEVETVEARVKDKDLELMVEKLREQRKEWVEVERAAGQGDQVMVDFEGRIDGELFEGGAGKDMPVEIGAGQMLPEFEAGLGGMSSGEEKIVKVNFPEGYHGKDVAGKTAEFTLKATKISEAQLPEVDAEFIKAFGIEDGDIDKFHNDVRNNMEKELEQRVKQTVKNATLEALLKVNEIIAPSAMVTDEIKSQKGHAAERMGQDTSNFDPSSLPDDLFREEATKRVQIGLLVGELIKGEKIELDNSRVDSTLEDMAASYQDPAQVKGYYRQNHEARSQLEGMVLEDQVIEHILEKATVTKKQSSFEELINGSGQ